MMNLASCVLREAVTLELVTQRVVCNEFILFKLSFEKFIQIDCKKSLNFSDVRG